MQKLEELQAMFADGMIGSIDSEYNGIPLTIVREKADYYHFMKNTGVWMPIFKGTLKQVHHYITKESVYKNCVFSKPE